MTIFNMQIFCIDSTALCCPAGNSVGIADFYVAEENLFQVVKFKYRICGNMSPQTVGRKVL